MPLLTQNLVSDRTWQCGLPALYRWTSFIPRFPWIYKLSNSTLEKWLKLWGFLQLNSIGNIVALMCDYRFNVNALILDQVRESRTKLPAALLIVVIKREAGYHMYTQSCVLQSVVHTFESNKYIRELIRIWRWKSHSNCFWAFGILTTLSPLWLRYRGIILYAQE